MNKKVKAIRHGEICLVYIDELPQGLFKSESKVITQGSHNNSHSISEGELYFKNVDQYTFGYLVAKNTKLLHPEHGQQNKSKLRTAAIPDGVYELRKQQEWVNSELKPVID
jgi:hypothetical protein